MAINNEIRLQVRDFITEAINYLKKSNRPDKDNVNSALNSIREAIKLLYNLSDDELNELEIPWISIYYYPARQNINTDIVIPLYITDYYQKEYTFGDNSEYFTVKYEVDGVEHQIENVPTGDYDLHLGQLDAGMHYYGVQIVDSHGRSSRTIFNDLWIVDPTEYEIKESETYTITDSDLTTYSINKNNSEVVDDMINNRVGLSQLFLDLQAQGYRKAILPQGTYRINRCTRMGTIAGKDTPIDIPTNFTLDMNGSTFKLHPYNDTEYGTIAKVENLMIRMKGTFDSHIINGTFEGDYAERKANGWITGSNGEANNTFYAYGAEFCSLDNILVKQTTGYNIMAGQNGSYGSAPISSWSDNTIIENGEEKTKEGFVTSNLATMNQEMLDHNYVVYSVYLAFGGLKGLYWEMEFHFYNENQEFIKTVKSYQYTRCRIPTGAKYVRVTLRGDSSQVSGVYLHHMRSTRYFECNNCDWEDNRTCSAISQVQHYAYNNCTFARSGQSITPCEIDLEDGWEQQQDVFLNNCETTDTTGSTTGIIDNSGLNHVFDGCKLLRATVRYRVRGLIMRNCTNSTFSLTSGFMTGNTVKVENNELTGADYSVTEIDYLDYDKVLICYKNNILRSPLVVDKKHNIIFKGNTHYTNAGRGYHIIDGTIYPTGNSGYIAEDIIVEDSTYKLAEGETESEFSFNMADVSRIYRRCIFEAPCRFKTHNAFSSGLWEDCIFKENMIINPGSVTLTNDSVLFINCVFEKDLTLTLGNSSYCTFAKCTFLGNVTYTGTSQSRCIITDEIPSKLSYIKLTLDPKLTCIDSNVDYGLSVYSTPFNVTDDPITLTTNNKNFVITRDEVNDRYLLNCNSTTGKCIITASTKTGLQQTMELDVVDVDYSIGYVGPNGAWNSLIYNYTDNNYREASGTIKISYDSSFGISYLRLAEYDENKKFVKAATNIAVSDSSATVNLDSSTRYVRVTFRPQSGSEKRFPLLFSTYTITNV